MVKKSLLIVACLLSLTLCALILATNIAKAESAHYEADTVSWARIVKDDVYFYKSADTSKPLFILEKSYYVQIIQELDNMYRVEVIPSDTNEESDFLNIFGYVRRSDVSICSTPPIVPYYPAVKIKVTADSAVIKKLDESTPTQGCLVYNSETMCYYGKRVISGTTWYYVSYEGRDGYVEASAVSPPQVSLHPTPLPQKPASTTPSTPDDPIDNTPTESALPASEILLIVFIVVLAVGLMLALFLPGNLKKKNNIFEQDI